MERTQRYVLCHREYIIYASLNESMPRLRAAGVLSMRTLRAMRAMSTVWVLQIFNNFIVGTGVAERQNIDIENFVSSNMRKLNRKRIGNE